MRFACVAFGLLAILLSGCHNPKQPSNESPGEPKYVTNWSRLKEGMSKNQVRNLLGMPAYIMRYNEDTAHVPRAREFGDQNAALKADVEAIFGEPHMWQYGRFDVMGPAEEAFLVYFDAAGHVTHWRQPLSGPLANTTRPVEPKMDSDEALRRQNPSDLWNTPTLQRK